MNIAGEAISPRRVGLDPLNKGSISALS